MKSLVQFHDVLYPGVLFGRVRSKLNIMLMDMLG